MNQFDKEINQEQDMDGFARARKLREEAEALEAKERIKRRLLQLMEISKDPYFDQYLNQMLKDLNSGKATAKQVEKEADRTWALYQQRMGIKVSPKPQTVAPVVTQNPAPTVTTPQNMQVVETHSYQKTKDTMEFKIGAGIFSTVGAVFVLVALVIIGFHFLQGIWQGLCLYAVSLAVILVSELILRKLNKTFSLVITGIGISSLFISTVINYFVLKTVNGLAAAIITICIAILSIWISRKKDATSIRLITFLGCYICFLPIKGFESELNFLIMIGLLSIVQIVSIFLPNQNNREIISCVHMAVHTVFTGVVTTIVLLNEMDAIYASFFIIISLILLNLIFWRQKEENKIGLNITFSISLGFIAIFLVCAACFSHGVSSEPTLLFYKLLTEVMAIVVALVFFILINQEKERWIQYYFIAGIVVLFNGFSDYKLEATIGILALFVLTRILCGKGNLWILDAILAVIVALQGIYMSGEWYAVPFVVIMLLSIFTVKKMTVFHEIVMTLFFIGVLIGSFDGSWLIPGCMGILLAMFLLCNHLPVLKGQNHLPYNIVNVTFAGLFSLITVFCEDYWSNAVVILIGVAVILIVFRERYELGIPKKYLLLAGYLTFMILGAHFETPVIVSILLMIVAIGCVGIGFKLRDKVYRICGLVMAVIVCLKIILYDFRELDTLPKAVLFLVVGVIALAISFLYIYLEKKEDKEEENEKLVEEKGVNS